MTAFRSPSSIFIDDVSSLMAQVAVADLDLKPLEKIDEHYQLDCTIMHQAKQQRFAALLT